MRVLADGIKPRWNASRGPGPAEPPPYSVSGDHVKGTPERGAVVFERACSGCHGSRGEGDEAGAINDRSFLALISDQALRRYTITGRPDLGMPDFAASDGREDSFQPLSATEIDDLVALLAALETGWIGRQAMMESRSMDSTSAPTEPAAAAESVPARRGFFRMLTAAFSAVAGVFVGLPIVGYLWPGRSSSIAWVRLGPLAEFPADETRLVTFENPIRQPWDGLASHIGVYVRNEGKDADGADRFLVLAANCAHLGVPSRGFPSPVCSCVRVTAVFITPAASVPRGHRRGACFAATGASAAGSSKSRRPITRPCRTLFCRRRRRPTMGRWLGAIGRWIDARVGFREGLLPILAHPIPRGAAGRKGWWYVFGSASMTLLGSRS